MLQAKIQPMALSQSNLSSTASPSDLEDALEEILWKHRAELSGMSMDSMDLSDLCDDDEESCEMQEVVADGQDLNGRPSSLGAAVMGRSEDGPDNSLDDLLGTRIV